MMAKPTLRTLAAELGLSVTTVSRALAGHSDVSQKTREQVCSAAERAGYVANQNARRLVMGRTDMVGVVLPFPPDESDVPDVNDPFINEFLRHVAHALQRLPHLDLIVGYAHDDHDPLGVYKRLVQGRRVDGFLVARTLVDDERVDYLLKHNVPFVCHGRTRHAGDHAWVDTSARQAFGMATRRLVALGHERIALINMPARYFTAQLRAQGYASAMQDARLDLVSENCELKMQGGYQTALSLLKVREPPTALLCSTDILAVGAMRAVRDVGLAPGRDVSVIGADDLPLARLLEPELASMSYSYDQVGNLMVDMLEQQLEEQRIVPEHHLIDFKLIERGSMGPLVPQQEKSRG